MTVDPKNIARLLPDGCFTKDETDPLYDILEALDMVNEKGREIVRILVRDAFSDTAQGAGLDVILNNRGIGRLNGLNDERAKSVLQNYFATQRSNIAAIKGVVEAAVGYTVTVTDGDGGVGNPPGQRVIRIDISSGVDLGAPGYAFYAGMTYTGTPATITNNSYPFESSVAGLDYAWGGLGSDVIDLINDMKIAGWRIEIVT